MQGKQMMVVLIAQGIYEEANFGIGISPSLLASGVSEKMLMGSKRETIVI